MSIKNRKELKEYFYQTLLKKQDLEEDQERLETKPKSFIIESNNSPEEVFKGEWKIFETEDPELKKIKFNDNLEFFLDILDKRFWILHSLDSSKESWDVLRSLIKENNSKLDFIWLPSAILEKIGEFGKQTSFGLKFDNKFIEDEESIEQVSMWFWGGPAKEIMNDLKNNSKIKQAITISNLGIKYSPNKDFYIKDNVSSFGKFTVIKGDAIEPHFNLVNRIKNLYSELLNKIENEYRINYGKEDSRIKIEGDYLLLKFSQPLNDLHKFIETLTSCNGVFRIWGLWNEIEKDYIKANCVDLHAGHKFSLELSHEWMRIYLDKETCGNIITRLFTNLQRSFDAKIELYGVANERIM